MLYVETLPTELRQEAQERLRLFADDRTRRVRFWTVQTVKLSGVFEPHELLTIADTMNALACLEDNLKR